MRGENINRFAGDLHRLFEEVAAVQPSVKLIGIGDGANEIGMGAIPWKNSNGASRENNRPAFPVASRRLEHRRRHQQLGRLRVAAAVALLRDQVAAIAAFDGPQQLAVLKAMVEDGPGGGRCDETARSDGRRTPLPDVYTAVGGDSGNVGGVGCVKPL